MSSSGENFVVDGPASQERLKSLSLLASLVQLSKNVKHCSGPSEEELRKASALGDYDFNCALSVLLNHDKCIQHRYSREGTVGPFAHRYEVAKGLTFRVSWGEEAKS